MQLAYVDRAARHLTYILPRDPGENRTAYTVRFFREIRGLGNVAIVTVKGNIRRTRSVRGL